MNKLHLKKSQLNGSVKVPPSKVYLIELLFVQPLEMKHL